MGAWNPEHDAGALILVAMVVLLVVGIVVLALVGKVALRLAESVLSPLVPALARRRGAREDRRSREQARYAAERKETRPQAYDPDWRHRAAEDLRQVREANDAEAALIIERAVVLRAPRRRRDPG